MDNRFIGLVIGLVVGVLLIATLMAPTISEIQKTSGDKITLTNETNSVFREAKSGDVLTCTSVYVTEESQNRNTWDLNGEPVVSPTGGGGAWELGIMSDGVYMQIRGLRDSAMAIYYDMTKAVPDQKTVSGASASNNRVLSYTFGDSTIDMATTIGETTTTITFAYTWAYVVCPYGEGQYCAAVTGGEGMISSADEIILCGAYTTGENDTMYWYKDGVSHLSNTAYTMAVDIDTELHDNTTDIYDFTLSVDIGGETFTPYRVLVPYEVSGHKDSGAAYSLYGVFVVLFIVAVLMFAVRYIINRD